jgi:hypothetical protein
VTAAPPGFVEFVKRLATHYPDMMRECARHSGIPPCCADAFMLWIRGVRTRRARVVARNDYVMCAKCAERDRIAVIRSCSCPFSSAAIFAAFNQIVELGSGAYVFTPTETGWDVRPGEKRNAA